MRRTVLVSSVSILALIGLISAQVQPGSQDLAAKSAVDQLLELYDQGKFTEIYQTKLDPTFKANFSGGQWTDLAMAFAKRTGREVSRTLLRQAASMGI
jgi:hypothetical protein